MIKDMKDGMRAQKHTTFWILLALFFIAALFRIFLFRFRFTIKFDEPMYLLLAARASEEGLSYVLHPHWAPFYPFLIAVFSFISKNFELVAKMISVFMGSIVVFPIYALASELFDKKTAVISALMIACFPPLAKISADVLTEATFMGLSMTGIWLGWQALKRRSIPYGLATGLVFGMSYLTRPDGIGMMIVFIGWGFLAFLFRWKKSRSVKMLLILGGAAVMFVAAMSPYVRYLHKQTGHWTISEKWSTGRYDIGSLRSLSEDNKTLPIDMGWHQGTFHQLKSEEKTTDSFTGITLLKRISKNYYDIVKVVIPRLMIGPLFLMCILALFYKPINRSNFTLTSYLLCFIIFFWFIVMAFLKPMERYMLPFLPIMFLWIARGSLIFTEWINLSMRNLLPERLMIKRLFQLAPTLLTLFILIIFAFSTEMGRIAKVDPNATDILADPVEQKKAGLWLKEHADQTPVIMSHNHSVAYYAGNYHIEESVSIPDNCFERTMAYAKFRHVDYLLVNDRYADIYYPKLSFLLKNEPFPPEVSMVYEDVEPNQLKTRLFKVNY